MPERIVLHTSLPPKVSRLIDGAEVGQAYLAECVRSWRRAGFDVVSLNNARETEVVRELGYEVEFREIGGNRPSIGDFLNAIQSSGRPVAGIINADIFLSNDAALLAAIADRSVSGMTMIERINIDPATLRPTGRSCYGFDAFFFRTDLIAQIDIEHDFLFGQPWWDYWFPLAYAARGGKLMVVPDPLLFHLDHPQSWIQQRWIDNARKTVEYFAPSPGKLPGDVADYVRKLAALPVMSESELGPFAHWCFARLRNMAKPIERSPGSGDHAPLQALLSVVGNPDQSGLLGELNKAQASITDLREQRRAQAHHAAVRTTWEEHFIAELFGQSTQALLATAEDQLERSIFLAQLRHEIQRISWAVDGKPFVGADEALLATRQGAGILVSRNRMLSHFMALNIAWAKRLLQRGQASSKEPLL
jgi:hypothetical protein